MVNEWTKVELYGANNDGQPRRYTIADGTSVSKGTLMALTTPRTASVATAAAGVYAGVASEEHPASVGITSISCWTDGIFVAVCSDAITAGQAITGGRNNQINPAIGSASGSMIGAGIIGYALDTGTASGATQSTITARLQL